MEQAEAVEIKPRVCFFSPLQQLQRALQSLQQVLPAGCHVGQIQLPAAGVRHLRRVPPAVSAGLDGRQQRAMGLTLIAQMAQQVAADPAFLKPAQMPELPQRRVERGQQGHRQGSIWQGLLKLRQEMQRVVARVHEGERQHIAPALPDAGRVDQTRVVAGCGH